jgi:hypothetical protein
MVGPLWPIPILVRYIALVFKHFAKNLLDVMDEFDRREPKEPLEISIPLLGEDAASSRVRRDIEQSLQKWRYNQALGRGLDDDTAVDGVFVRPTEVHHDSSRKATLPEKRAGAIIAARIPIDEVSKKRMCIAFGQASNPCQVKACKFAHRVKLSKEWLDYIHGGSEVKPDKV